MDVTIHGRNEIEFSDQMVQIISITSITFLVSQNISLRGKNTTYGNFRDLIALICNDILELKARFNSENRKSQISTTIQNEIIAIYANNIKKNILQNIHGPYSIM